MKTSLDCIPCLYKQALFTARICQASVDLQKDVLVQVSKIINNLDLNASPPENSIAVYNLISRLCKTEDPFAHIREESNRLALELIPYLTEKISTAADPIQTAIMLSIAGNIIDYGSHQQFDLHQTITHCLNTIPAINDYNKFQNDLAQAKTILYLGDNSGELVFDRLLIELLEPKVIFAVKEKPIINDALHKDARFCGLDQVCEVISNGTGCPGTPLQQCSNQFKKIFMNADLIISKGQGNFETLSETAGPIYFLLTVKCPIVGRHIAEAANMENEPSLNDLILMKTRKPRK